jgi:hypothetical protein
MTAGNVMDHTVSHHQGSGPGLAARKVLQQIQVRSISNGQSKALDPLHHHVHFLPTGTQLPLREFLGRWRISRGCCTVPDAVTPVKGLEPQADDQPQELA